MSFLASLEMTGGFKGIGSGSGGGTAAPTSTPSYTTTMWAVIPNGVRNLLIFYAAQWAAISNGPV